MWIAETEEGDVTVVCIESRHDMDCAMMHEDGALCDCEPCLVLHTADGEKIWCTLEGRAIH